MHKSWKYGAILAFTLLCTAGAIAAKEPYVLNVRWIELSFEPNQIVSQGSHELGCGYTAILNCLATGSAAERAVLQSLPGQDAEKRIKHLMDKYGSRPSKQHKTEKRQNDQGIGEADLLDTYNELRQEHRLPLLAGAYLNRQKGEEQTELLARIHRLLSGSLAKGEAPLLSLTAQVANWNSKLNVLLWDFVTGRNPMNNGCVWDSIEGHYVTVVGVSEALNKDGSFSVDCIDPADGKMRRILLHSDPRNFAAFKGSAGDFLDESRPFAVVGGSLDLNTSEQTWSSRTVIYPDYVIYMR